MPHLPIISGDDFAKAMQKIGYKWDHTEGSHMILLHPSKGTAFSTKTQRIRAWTITCFDSRCRFN